MEKIVWDDKLKIGVDVVDRAHAKLFRIMQKLQDISKDVETNVHTFKEGIKYLEAYSMTHFAEEEAYMRSIRYKEYAHHKKIHDNFRDVTLISLRQDLELSGYSARAVQRFLATMQNWLKEHIMREDQAIVGKATVKRGFDVSAQVPVISKAVNRAAMEAFQTETKLISAEYKGQNIGNGYYCRHNYDVEDGVRVQLLLGVEEPLLLRGVSLIQGTQTAHSHEITTEIVVQIFTRLFRTMDKLFKAEEAYHIEKDELLTRDEFRTDFMKGYPCSLLFGTKTGYFIFCYRSMRIKSHAKGNAAGK